MGGALTLGDFSTAKMTRLVKPPSVEDAIDRGQIFVHLQPVLELSTGRVYGYEALARCKVAQIASPLHLFAAAQEQHAITKLGRELRRQSVDAVKGATLFLNVHPWELDDQDIVEDEDPIAKHTGKLVIEIPEGSPLLRYRFSDTNLKTLRERGHTIALDDFGAGYSNIAYIAQLQPEFVKLDRELIAGVTNGSPQATLLHSLNDLCRAQGAVVVAEGIETQEELDVVIGSGIELAQGYFLGRPSMTGAAIWPRV